MKNNRIKLYSTFICLLASVVLIAQPGSGSDTGNLETPDPAAPIDSMLYVLVIAAVVFAFFIFRNKRKIA